MAQMFAEASPVQVVHHLHLGNAQKASDGCMDLWGWLYAPRVSYGGGCMDPVCHCAAHAEEKWDVER